MSPQKIAQPDTQHHQSQEEGSSQTANQKIECHKQETENQAQEVKQDTQSLAEDVKGRAKQMKKSAQEQTQATLEKGQQQLREQTERVKAQGESLANRQKQRMADEVSTFGSAIREAANKLHEEEDEAVAQYADMAAARADHFSQYLRDRDLGQLVDDAENLTRSKPELVYGGLFVAGLGIARFLKASSSRRRSLPTT